MEYYACFAYGSNLNMDQMGHRCPHSRPIGPAILPGYRLEFWANGSGMGFATVSPAPDKRVLGGLWAIAEIDLPRLDRYEGYPSLYTRRMLLVQHEGNDRKALTYIMTPGHILAEPGRLYIDICLQGYEDFGLDKRAFWGAVNRTRMITGGYERRQRTAW